MNKLLTALALAGALLVPGLARAADDVPPSNYDHVTNFPLVAGGAAFSVTGTSGSPLAVTLSLPLGSLSLGPVSIVGGGLGSTPLLVNPDGSINVFQDRNSSSGAGGSVTLSTTSAVVLPPQQRRMLAIDNESASIAIACSFGTAAAVLNTGGNWTIPAGQTRAWPVGGSTWVPNDQVNCIAASGTPSITIQAN